MALSKLDVGSGLMVACSDVGPLSARSAVGALPLVLLHGVGADHHEWTLSLPVLVRHRRLLMFDLLGHGRSDKPSGPGVDYRIRLLADAVASGLERLGVERVDLVGHSLGGAVALDIVRRSPRLVRRLVLVDAAGLHPGHALHPSAMSLPFAPRNFRESQLLLRTSVNAPLLNNTLVAFAASVYKRRRENRPQLMKLLAAIASGEDALTAGDLRRIRHETLVLWGAQDRIFPVSTGRNLARLLPNARLEILPRCGHVPPTERPVAFARRVNAFLLP